MNPDNFYVKLMDWDFGGGNYDTTGNGLNPYAYAGQGAVTNVDYARQYLLAPLARSARTAAMSMFT